MVAATAAAAAAASAAATSTVAAAAATAAATVVLIVAAIDGRRLILSLRRRRRRRIINCVSEAKPEVPLRIYLDGCFDLMHYGHCNALRQAKALGNQLIVGLVADDEITVHKGPPVLSFEERHRAVSAVKWVDEVIPNVPYELTPAFLDELFTKHKIDFVVHGDDACLTADGKDAYAYAKALGKFKLVKRTEGVSTTDIVERLLQRSTAPQRGSDRDQRSPNKLLVSNQEKARFSHFLPTSRRIAQFSDAHAIPSDPAAQVVYLAGPFDVFHPGHLTLLQAARAQGKFLLVGLWSDEDVAATRGSGHPIMGLHERSLHVLAHRCVDEVVIGAPMAVSQELITTFNIRTVIKPKPMISTRSIIDELGADDNLFKVPKALGILKDIPYTSEVTTSTLVARILANKSAYEERNRRKIAAEDAYLHSKTFVHEI